MNIPYYKSLKALKILLLKNKPDSFFRVSSKTKSESDLATFSSFLRSLPEPTGPKIKTNNTKEINFIQEKN